jgi:hypothetical protein
MEFSGVFSDNNWLILTDKSKYASGRIRIFANDRLLLERTVRVGEGASHPAEAAGCLRDEVAL